ncbi:hypothetical protein M7I_1065 [Glarea lozoyensis 74030]|uniref:DUF7892 domain-containing protein n=1 Tax=Glarea lozoyensis (strain ATCC 74030 / MF5533) TaxID=1104152 RepID=H0EF27_GLAL7|nr:hypothetical protein M7I_1065 [Glarea lozoyensis 74030]
MSSPALSTDDSDSDSDVSMSAGTDDEEDDRTLTHLTNRNSEQSKVLGKRKLSSESPTSQMETDMSNEARKRLKLAGSIVPYRTPNGRLHSDKSFLPAEIWHRIFTFCHPRVLGRLLQVNKSFNAYIDPSSTAHPVVRSPEFLKSQIEEIKKDFEDAKSLGAATAEEWLKGLEERGKEKRSDGSRWERWENSGGLLSIGILKPPVVEAPISAKKEPIVKIETSTSDGLNSVNQYQLANPLPSRNFPPFSAGRPFQPIQTSLPMNPPNRFESPSQNGFTSYAPARLNPQRQERTREEVDQMKAARRTEIERRCMSLDPPLTPGVLAHMPSFRAAIQISQQLTDGSWEVLKPRLLSQREEAEQREHDQLAQIRIAQEHSDERQQQDISARSDSKDLIDREWDDVQAPLRARIGGYADETIYNGWDRGNKVNYESSPKFAADVLIYVRKRFYAEMAKDEAAMRATGREPDSDPPNGPYLRKLILENMKWVFDTKIKPYTEPYRKELFLCNDPHCGIHSKWYGFEGVIQHFAAKHTSTLSVGSIVVHWKSEWPEYPPFNPDPSTIPTPPYYNGPPSASAQYLGNGPVLQQNLGFGGYQSAPVSGPMPGSLVASQQNPVPVPMPPPMHASNPHGYNQSQAPYYGPPRFGEQFQQHQSNPYPPPQPYSGTSQGYPVQHFSAPSTVNGGYNQTPQDYSQHGYSQPHQVAGHIAFNPTARETVFPATAPVVPAPQDTHNAQHNHYPLNHGQPVPQVNKTPPQKSEEYKAQLKEVGKSVRDTWNTINPIKEIPGSVKVYTIIHHLLENSRVNNDNEPTLSMIIDGLSNNKEMRPARNINGLLCRACVLGLAGSKPNQPKKHFSFPQLVNHFHTVHEQASSKNSSSYSPDWRKEMVELPEISKISHIFQGNDDQRLKLITEALPELLPTPISNNENIHPLSANGHTEATSHPYPELVPSQDGHHNYYAKRSDTEPSSNGNITYESGEYDPRNPQELPVDARPVPRFEHPRGEYIRDDGYEPSREYGHLRREEEARELSSAKWQENSYTEPGPRTQHLHGRHPDNYERAAEIDRNPRYRDVDERDYPIRAEPVPAYTPRGAAYADVGYRAQNVESYQSNVRDISSAMDVTARNRIFDVVAQISQQAQKAHDRLPQDIPAEGGSEDGEVRTGHVAAQADDHQIRPQTESSDAAERFLNTFLREPSRDDVSQAKIRYSGAERAYDRDFQRDYPSSYGYQIEAESRRPRSGNDTQARPLSGGGLRQPTREEYSELQYNGNLPAQPRSYAYEDRQRELVGVQYRERSPELVDRRYKVNNVVYRDERQNSHTTHRTPSRYARYESVRLENDRARSRSPAYVNKPGGQSGYNSLRSPAGPPFPQDSAYRTLTPQPAVEEFTHGDHPRQEYYRIYPPDPRPRSPEAYELVRVADAHGEYVVRRPIRRGPEPFYAPYEDEGYSRRPLHERRPSYGARVPVERVSEPRFEEYDPRHPEPPPITTARQPSSHN